MVQGHKRLFFAVPISDEARDELARTQEQMKKQFRWSKVSWVAPEILHITLHFLAEVHIHLISKLVSEVNQLAMPQSFELTLDGADAFPSKKDPHILVVYTSIHPFLLVLRKRLADVLVANGLPIDERPFRPHMTLGRVRSRAEVLQPAQIITRPISFLIESVILFESEQTPNGSNYTPLARFPLFRPF